METLKTIAIVLTFIFGMGQMHALKNFNTIIDMTEQLETLFAPYLAHIRDYYLVVSFPKDCTIKVKASNIPSEACYIPSIPIEESQGENITAYDANVLGNKKVILALFGPKDNNQTVIWLYAIDYLNCRHKVINFTLNSSRETVQNDFRIVVYNDSFDIFLYDDVLCNSGNICKLRYNDKLMLTDINKSVFPFNGDSWYIDSTKDFSSMEYIYMITSENSTTIKLLNEDMQNLNEIQFNLSTSSSDFLKSEDGLQLCFQSNNTLEYYRLNEKLEIKIHRNLSFSKNISAFTIFPLKTSNDIIIIFEEHSNATYLQHINPVETDKNPVETDKNPVETDKKPDETDINPHASKFQEPICEEIYTIGSYVAIRDIVCSYVICHDSISVKCIRPKGKLNRNSAIFF